MPLPTPLDQLHPGMRQRLGQECDTVIARDYGLSRERIRQIRAKLSIPVNSKFERKPTPLDQLHPGMRQRLGKEPDGEIAPDYGLSKRRVCQIRIGLGIQGYCSPKITLTEDLKYKLRYYSDNELAKQYKASPSRFKELRASAGIHLYTHSHVWAPEDVEQLGTVPDGVIAERLGISLRQVLRQRQKLQIPGYFRVPGARAAARAEAEAAAAAVEVASQTAQAAQAAAAAAVEAERAEAIAKAEAAVALHRGDYLRKQAAFDQARAALDEAVRLCCEAGNYLDDLRRKDA